MRYINSNLKSKLKLKLHHWNAVGLFYAITLAVTVGLILFLSKIFHIIDPTWALISAVVCTELDLGQARQLVMARIWATIIGAGLAVAVLMVLGPGYITILMGVVITTLACHYLMRVDNWKLATATGLMVLVISLQQHSVGFAENIAIKRALEVIAGSVAAGIVSLILGKFRAFIQFHHK